MFEVSLSSKGSETYECLEVPLFEVPSVEMAGGEEATLV